MIPKGYNKQDIEAIRDLVASFDGQYFIVLSPNKPTRNNRVTPEFYAARRREIHRWHARADRRLLGKRWCKNPNRTRFIAFPEIGPYSGLLHFNLLLTPPYQTGNPDRLWEAYDKAWTDDRDHRFNKMKSQEPWEGETDIQPVVPGTIDNCVSYARKWLAGKEFAFDLGDDPWFFSNER